MHDLTGFQRDLRYVVAGLNELHGLAVKEELEDYYEKKIHHGRPYPNLDTIVDKGLIEKGERDRRTNNYTVTKRGQRELDARTEWEDQYIPPVASCSIDSDILLRLNERECQLYNIHRRMN